MFHPETRPSDTSRGAPTHVSTGGYSHPIGTRAWAPQLLLNRRRHRFPLKEDIDAREEIDSRKKIAAREEIVVREEIRAREEIHTSQAGSRRDGDCRGGILRGGWRDADRAASST